MANRICKCFFYNIQRDFPLLFTGIETIHDILNGQTLFQPFGRLIVLTEKGAPDCLGINDMNLVLSLEKDAADDSLRNPLTTLIGKEHRDYIGHFSLGTKEFQILYKFGIGCGKGNTRFCFEILDSLVRNVFHAEPLVDGLIIMQSTGIFKKLTHLSRSAKFL